jgi:salicylate hydroxylase
MIEGHEQAPELGEVGAGVQISPNGSRALDALGVFETLKAASCAPRRKEFRLWNTGRAWPMFDLGPEAIENTAIPI